MSDIKQEFEKAFEEAYPHYSFNKDKRSADMLLWAAKFMAERCASNTEQMVGVFHRGAVAKMIRQLAKELSE